MILENLIAGQKKAAGHQTIQGVNPVSKEKLSEHFHVAIPSEIEEAAEAAHDAWKSFRFSSGEKRATFLEAIAEEIEACGDNLVERAMEESGLPEGRIRGERGRTCGQLRLFAELVREGSWVQARIDEAIPDRKPLPRADIRKALEAIGPVAVFGASNFPLAFSTAGGDTASAFAAGCPVIVKGHPSHPGTHTLVSEAISRAVEKSELSKGVFSAVHGGIPASQALVTHPRIRAVGFTGSLQGGKALMELASKRPEPIPVYAEMGSVNPLFILPSALKEDITKLASSLANSVNLGAGQFCTNPGLMVFQKSPELEVLFEELSNAFLGLNPQTMLNEGIYKHFKHTKSQILSEASVTTIEAQDEEESWNGYPAIGRVGAADFIQNDTLHQEVFGPFTLAIICENQEEMKAVAESIEGQLTGTVMGSEQEIEAATDLVSIIAQKVGRIIFNGVPTGVEVSHAMHHGGPFPASSNGMYTSVGTDAILRYARPVCYQNAPDSILPDSLKRSNPLGIWRKVNGELTKK